MLVAYDISKRQKAHLKAKGGPRGAAAYLRSLIERDMANEPVKAELEVAALERDLADARARAATAVATAAERREAAWGDLVAMKVQKRTEKQFIDWLLNRRFDSDTPGQRFMRKHGLSSAQAIEIFREVRAIKPLAPGGDMVDLSKGP